ncbi:translation initiation factor IF-2 subunit gamma [Candidatus Parvarchaeota archaeon]|nr:translation initiation factor IF-2 subunit gamma [Candidatus Parvarchaeota archaeon]
MVEDIIIDIVGSFADGKTTLVKAMTRETTLRHSEEIKRGITIRLGYAHFIVYRCGSCGRYSRTEKCEYCNGASSPHYRVSIIDSPGHKTLMTIMLSGASLVDGAVLVIAANQPCPQPQTQEHLEALKIIGIKNMVVAQTKVDVVGEQRARQSYSEIKSFLSQNGLHDVPIIPVFSIQDINIGELIQWIGRFKIEKADRGNQTEMVAIRSFDINKPGADIKKMNGAVLGGALKQGTMSKGDSVTVYPGVFIKNSWKPLNTKIASIQSEFGEESRVGPGLMVGVRTMLDPSLSRRDNLAGSLVVGTDSKPLFKNKISIEYSALEEKEKQKFKRPIQRNESVLVNVLASKVLGTVTSVNGRKVTIFLNNSFLPYFLGDKAIISRKVDNIWVLAGAGTIYD